MVRQFQQTYTSAIDKLGWDRSLSAYLTAHRSPAVKDTAWRLARCSDDHNIWFIEAPESGWIHGRFWKCSSRLCSYCLSADSRRRRKTLREALTTYHEIARSPRWQFLTLTIENPHTSLLRTREVVNQAWSKLRKRACFVAVRAGAKSEEFTLRPRGYHYHLHTLLDHEGPPDYQLWRKTWTECVENSGGSSQRLFGFDTADQYLIIKFVPVRDPNNITNELCKYITKSTSFEKLSKSAILELAEVKRWNRMFEVFGDLRKTAEPRERGTERASSIVHTKRLSDGRHTDMTYFENRRQYQRYFQIDHLEILFGSRVWTLPEIRNAMTSGKGDICLNQDASTSTDTQQEYSSES